MTEDEYYEKIHKGWLSNLDEAAMVAAHMFRSFGMVWGHKESTHIPDLGEIRETFLQLLPDGNSGRLRSEMSKKTKDFVFSIEP